MTFETIEAQGTEALLEQLRDELTGRTYKPLPARRQEIRHFQMFSIFTPLRGHGAAEHRRP